MHSETAVDEPYNGDDTQEKQTFVDDINIPGFVDDTMFYDEVPVLSENVTDTARATEADSHVDTSSSGAAVPVPDFDGAVISVFAVAVILLVVGQVAVICRQRHRRSCRRRFGKWNVPAFGQLHGVTPASHSSGQVIHSPPPSEVWTALPSSPLSDLFHSDHYRTAAFAYINRRSTDSLPSTAAAASRTGSSGSADSSSAAIFVRPGSSVTWSDIGEMTSSSPEKRPTTSLSLSSSCEPNRLDAEAQTDDGQETIDDDDDDRPETSTINDAAFSATDDDVNMTSSASVSCSPTHSIRSTCDDDEDTDQCATARDDLQRDSSFTLTVDHVTPRDDLGQDGCFSVSVDHSQPASPTSVSNSSTDLDTHYSYIELTTDCSTAHLDTDNSTC